MKTTSTPTAAETLLSQDEAAALLGLESRTLEAWRARGSYKLPFVKIGPRIVRYRLSDLHQFIDRQTVQPITMMA